MNKWRVSLTHLTPGGTGLSAQSFFDTKNTWTVIGTYESAVNFAFKEMLRLLAGKFGLGPIRATPEPGQVNAEHLKIKAVHLLSDIERNWYPGAAQTARDHFGWHFMITQGVEQTVEAIEFADIRRQARQMQGIPHSPYR